MAARPIEVGPIGRHVAASLGRGRRALSLTQADLSQRLDAAGWPLPAGYACLVCGAGTDHSAVGGGAERPPKSATEGSDGP